MKLTPLKLTFDYSDTSERKVISLERDGISCIPVIGIDNYQKVWKGPPIHCHPECMEFSLCFRGGLDFEFRGEIRKLMPGNMAVSGPDDPHRFCSYPKRLGKYWMLLRIPKRHYPLLKLPQREAEWLVKELTSLSGRIFNGEKLEPLFQRIFHIYDTIPRDAPERPLLLRSAVTELLIRIAEVSKVPPKTATNAQLKEILDEMSAHPEREYPIDVLVERTGVSRSNILNRFKKFTGLPPHAFLMSQRISKAKELIEQSGMSISAIADFLGFSSSQHFSTCFKQATGKMPSEWVNNKSSNRKVPSNE